MTIRSREAVPETSYFFVSVLLKIHCFFIKQRTKSTPTIFLSDRLRQIPKTDITMILSGGSDGQLSIENLRRRKQQEINEAKRAIDTVATALFYVQDWARAAQSGSRLDGTPVKSGPSVVRKLNDAINQTNAAIRHARYPVNLVPKIPPSIRFATDGASSLGSPFTELDNYDKFFQAQLELLGERLAEWSTVYDEIKVKDYDVDEDEIPLDDGASFNYKNVGNVFEEEDDLSLEKYEEEEDEDEDDEDDEGDEDEDDEENKYDENASRLSSPEGSLLNSVGGGRPDSPVLVPSIQHTNHGSNYSENYVQLGDGFALLPPRQQWAYPRNDD
ncbi:hypothetical protein F4804DRAFT_319643 [Jackrogersella minutella]|nr:hypothetical protein F4804DRAFT_319643 [Jackrogersella minutella]